MARGIDVGGLATAGVAVVAGLFIYKKWQQSQVNAGIITVSPNTPEDRGLLSFLPGYEPTPPAVSLPSNDGKILNDTLASVYGGAPNVRLDPEAATRTVFDAMQPSRLQTIFQDSIGGLF